MSDVKINKHPLGFYQIEEKPSTEFLKDYYAKKYYQEEKGNYRLVYDDAELAYINAKIGQKFELINSWLSSNEKTLLDIGCGEGFTLRYFKEEGYHVTGLDFSDYGCMAMNPDCVQHLITGDVFENIGQFIRKEQKFDVIWMSNLLEHVLDPVQLLKDCQNLISDGGILIIQVPNDYSELQEFLLDRNKISKEFWIAYPDHISYFNKESLMSCAQYAGWKSLDCLADFPIDWYLVNDHANYISDRSKGKEAHRSRIELELLIHANGPDQANDFFRSLANIGMGRQISGFFQKSGT
jgi:2-polyprenyl-3-methyl-5-hydroxy-6-metoxy-1,4-benzoquinol methylase